MTALTCDNKKLVYNFIITSHPNHCPSSAARERRRAAPPRGQQDRVCSAGPGAGPEEGLPANQRRGTRRETLQGLHLQLLPQVHEHGAEER